MEMEVLKDLKRKHPAQLHTYQAILLHLRGQTQFHIIGPGLTIPSSEQLYPT